MRSLRVLIKSALGAGSLILSMHPYCPLMAQAFVPTPDTVIISDQNANLAWADYDNDGDLDIMLTSDYGLKNPFKIFSMNNTGVFAETTTNLSGGSTVSKNSFAWGDYDHDSDLDLILTGFDGESSVGSLFRNDGSNFFTDISNQLLYRPTNGSVAWGDYDNDGDLDFFMMGSSTQGRIYRNDGHDSFQTILLEIPEVYFGSVSWADFDEDHDLDILLVGWLPELGRGISRVYRNDGNDKFLDIQATLTGVFTGTASWGDYDNDGDLDILLTGHTDSGKTTKIYRNDGSSEFTDIEAGLPGLDWSMGAWGDADNDGDLDIAIIGENGDFPGVLKIFRNDGGDTFRDLNESNLRGGGRSALAWGDYDKDGDLDLVCSHFGKLYRNNTSRQNSRPSPPSSLGANLKDDPMMGATVTLGWNQGGDAETPALGLTYNLRMGTFPAGINIVPPMSSMTGYRQIVGMGNAFQNLTWTIKALKRGTYYWSVQSIDHSFVGSPFSKESSFSVPNHPPRITSVPDTLGHFSYLYQVTASDFDQDSLRFSLVTDADFLSIDSLTGLVTGTAGLYRSGRFSVEVQVDDGHGGIDIQRFTLHMVRLVPTSFRLHQNFPNPFNSTTEIGYDLPQPSHVTLLVYNVLGKQVRTLVDEFKSAGFERVVWNGKDDGGQVVGSGLYFYQIRAGQNIKTRRMMFLKIL